MRLERIEVIASDPEAPEDVRAVFRRIFPQERFHERAFRSLAGTEALKATRGAHEMGRTALGLSPLARKSPCQVSDEAGPECALERTHRRSGAGVLPGMSC